MKTLFPAPATISRAMSSASLVALCGAIGLMAGCASEPESHIVSAPPPQAPTVMMAAPAPVPALMMAAPTQVVVAAPAGAVVGTAYAQPSNNTIVVMQAPPAPQQEVVMARPSSNHLWVAGFWTWRNNRYEWMAGHWEVPSRPGAVWVAPRWKTENGAYRFYEGYWN